MHTCEVEGIGISSIDTALYSWGRVAAVLTGPPVAHHACLAAGGGQPAGGRDAHRASKQMRRTDVWQLQDRLTRRIETDGSFVPPSATGSHAIR